MSSNKIKDLKYHYKEVFGRDDESRGESQRKVLEDLRRRSNFNEVVFVESQNSGYCPIRAALVDGMRRVYITIDKMLDNK